MLDKLDELTKTVREVAILFWISGWGFTFGYLAESTLQEAPVGAFVSLCVVLFPFWPLVLGASLAEALVR